MSTCFDELSSWMWGNRLQVISSKTEVLWCASGRRQHQIPTSPVRIGTRQYCRYPLFTTSGYILTLISVCEHMSLPPSDRAALCQIRSVRRCLPHHALLTLIRALVVSKVDYCRSVLAGVSPRSSTGQSAVHPNAAVRLVFSALLTCHFSANLTGCR